MADRRDDNAGTTSKSVKESKKGKKRRDDDSEATVDNAEESTKGKGGDDNAEGTVNNTEESGKGETRDDDTGATVDHAEESERGRRRIGSSNREDMETDFVNTADDSVIEVEMKLMANRILGEVSNSSEDAVLQAIYSRGDLIQEWKAQGVTDQDRIRRMKDLITVDAGVIPQSGQDAPSSSSETTVKIKTEEGSPNESVGNGESTGQKSKSGTKNTGNDVIFLGGLSRQDLDRPPPPIGARKEKDALFPELGPPKTVGRTSGRFVGDSYILMYGPPESPWFVLSSTPGPDAQDAGFMKKVLNASKSRNRVLDYPRDDTDPAKPKKSDLGSWLGVAVRVANDRLDDPWHVVDSLNPALVKMAGDLKTMTARSKYQKDCQERRKIGLEKYPTAYFLIEFQGIHVPKYKEETYEKLACDLKDNPCRWELGSACRALSGTVQNEMEIYERVRGLAARFLQYYREKFPVVYEARYKTSLDGFHNGEYRADRIRAPASPIQAKLKKEYRDKDSDISSATESDSESQNSASSRGSDSSLSSDSTREHRKKRERRKKQERQKKRDDEKDAQIANLTAQLAQITATANRSEGSRRSKGRDGRRSRR